MTTKTRFAKIISLVLAVMMLSTFVFTIAACDDDSDKQYYDNETDKLVFSTQEVDKVFNPFFSTSATDSNVVGMTQIGMVGNDENGDVVYGDDEAVVAKDLEIITVGTPNVDQTTTYYFVLKNNVKFSNGSPLTMKDVLFNLYVYLDPAYTGSSTIYSTDIVGLQEYRTQAATEEEQEAFETKYKVAARARIDALIEATTAVLEDHMDEYIDEDTMLQYLADEWENVSDSYANVVKDFQKTAELFREELENDYSNSRDSYTDQLFTDKEGNVYRNLLTTDVEMFLLNEGFITWSKDEAKLHSSLVADSEIDTLKTWTQERAINTVYNATMPDSVEEVLTYWNTSVTLYDFLTKEEMEADKPADGVLEFPNISGIKFANYDTAVTVNGNSYAVPQYNIDGSVKDGYNEVLSITINNVDPKAIWNFAFAIAPLYYYSDEAHINSFSYAENRFGVEYKSQSFMENVVKNPDTIVLNGAGKVTIGENTYDFVKVGEFEGLDGTYSVTTATEYLEYTIDVDAKTYTVAKPMVDVAFDAGDKAAVATVNTNKNIGIQLPVPANDQFVFRGWYVDEACETAVTLVDGKYVPTSSVTLYAKWDAKVTLTIVYGNGMANGVYDYGANDALDMEQYKPAGANNKFFEGWYTDEALSEAFEATTITADTTVYVKWTDAGNYTLVSEGSYGFEYNAEGGYWANNNQGAHNSSASIKIAAIDGPVQVKVTYWISSEKNYDYLSSVVSGTVEGASINTKGSNYTQEEAQVGEFMLQQGATLSFTYKKDGSGNNGDDTAYLILEINGVVVTAYVPAE